jgi:hypothetical protein
VAIVKASMRFDEAKSDTKQIVGIGSRMSDSDEDSGNKSNQDGENRSDVADDEEKECFEVPDSCTATNPWMFNALSPGI